METERSNVPSQPLRWSVYLAAREFNLDRSTLAKRLANAEIPPGSDGLYSTGQILKAVVGDIDDVRLRKLIAQARQEELKTAQMEQQLAPVYTISQRLQSVVLAIRSAILSCSEISVDKQDELLGVLKGLKP
jgi:hypothetical protein